MKGEVVVQGRYIGDLDLLLVMGRMYVIVSAKNMYCSLGLIE